MVIQHNISAMNSKRNLSNNNNKLSGNLEKLSSGYKINRAADNAAGLAISEKMRTQITGLGAAYNNVEDGINLIKTGDGGMQEIHDMINRLSELAVLSANGTFDDVIDRDAIQQEVNELLDEIDRIADSTNFNGIYMLNGGSVLDCECGDAVVFPEPDAPEIDETFVSQLNINTSLVATAGGFTITGGVEGTDYSYSGGVLTILSNTDMRIEGGSGTERIVVDDSAGSANLALKDVNITTSSSTAGSPISTGANAVYIELEGTTNLTSGNSNYPGLHVEDPGSLTLNGDGLGILNAQGGSKAAGIGGGYSNQAVGAITINGGTINAYGGTYVNEDPHEVFAGAGIGGGGYNGQTVGDITITGGNVTAYGGEEHAAGIGGAVYGQTVGDITISGGKIYAVGGKHSAGIGGACSGLLNSTVGDISITGGEIKAIGGSEAAGIGSGYLTTVGDISITGGTVDAMGGTFGAAIGTGYYGVAGDITITNSDSHTLTAGTMSEQVVGKGYQGTIGTLDITPPLPDDLVPPQCDCDILGEIILQIGETSHDYNQLEVPIFDLHADNLDIDPFDVSTQDSALDCISKALSAVNQVSTYRSIYGGYENRLAHTASILSVMKENIQDSESTIRDTDIAEEMMEYTKNNILIQSSQSMLAHASSQPETVLQLLG